MEWKLSMKEKILWLVFFLENSKFCNKENGNSFFWITFLFSLYLVIQSSVKIYNQFDWFNISYLFIGIGLLTYSLYIGFYPSYKKLHNIRTLFGYKTLTEFYQRQK